MTSERTPGTPSHTPNAADDRLRDANEQLTLTSLQALQRAEESAQRYQAQARVLIKNRKNCVDWPQN